jgi:hypothetical protein
MKKIILCSILALFALQCVVAAQTYIAWDPTRNIPNGRVLGLGKAYMGLADDTGAIYSNPAGLAGIDSWQLSSMSGRFLEEFSYLSAAGLYPTRFGTIGIGFAGSFVGGAYVTKIADGSDPDDPIYELDTSVDPVSNSNTVTILSWGNQADKVLAGTTLSERIAFFKHPVFESISLGASFKYFFASLTGDHIASGAGDANGMEVDLGIQYQPPLKWLKLGLTAQNVLPFAMGGKLSYATGHEESYPAILEGGAAIRVLGQKDSLLKFRDQEVLLLVDMDYYPTISNYPTIMHLGAEWKPVPMMAVRMGIDQDVAGDGAGGLETLSNMTGGVGLIMGGFRFDYAYHQYVAAPGINNNYFSLSYGVAPPVEIKDGLVSEPDKVVTFDENIRVKGQAVLISIVTVKVNGQKARLDPNGNFSATAALDIGKNAILVQGFGRDGRLIESDVPLKHWAAKYVNLSFAEGIVKGYPDGTFRPKNNITRAEGVTMISRFSNVSKEAYNNEFIDVPASHWAAQTISGAHKAGMLEYLRAKPFELKRLLTRAESVEILFRSPRVDKMIKDDLLNWDSY